MILNMTQVEIFSLFSDIIMARKHFTGRDIKRQQENRKRKHMQTNNLKKVTPLEDFFRSPDATIQETDRH